VEATLEVSESIMNGAILTSIYLHRDRQLDVLYTLVYPPTKSKPSGSLDLSFRWSVKAEYIHEAIETLPLLVMLLQLEYIYSHSCSPYILWWGSVTPPELSPDLGL
jgi:hypothetical protein